MWWLTDIRIRLNERPASKSVKSLKSVLRTAPWLRRRSSCPLFMERLARRRGLPGVDLAQLVEDGGGGGPVLDVLPDVLGDDSLRCQDDGRGRCYPVAEQVEYAVGPGDRLVRVSKDGVPRAGALLHVLGAGHVVCADGDQLSAQGAYLIVGRFQLAELVDADPSEVSPVEDQDDGIVGRERIGEPDEAALRGGELEVRRGDAARGLRR